MKYISLSEIATYQQGKQISIDLQYDSPSVGLGRFVRIVDYTNKSEPPRYIKDVDTKYHVNEEDLVMIRYGSQTAGSVVRGISGIIANNLFQIKLKSNAFDKSFMYYYLSSSNVKKQLMGGQSSSTMPAITFGMMKNIMIPVFDLADQKRIAGLLDLLSEKIRINKEVNENLLLQVETLFKERFLTCDEMPVGWKRMIIGDVSDMSAGGDKPKNISKQKTEEHLYPIYSNGISEEGLYGFTSDYKISEESVTVSARGTIGFVCLRHIPFTPIVRLVTLVPHTSIVSAKYLYLWLKNIQIHGTGTTQQQLTVPDFRKTEIIIPPEAEMKEFTETVNPLFWQVWSNQAENEKLADMRDALLPKLMSGELDISKLDI